VGIRGRSPRRHQPPPRSRRWTCRRDAGDPRSQPTAGMRRACPLASNSAYVAQSQLSSMKALMTAILDLTPGTAPKRQVHRRSTAGLRKACQRSAQTATPRGAARDGPCVTRPPHSIARTDDGPCRQLRSDQRDLLQRRRISGEPALRPSCPRRKDRPACLVRGLCAGQNEGH
jgi:hypothetical protein